MNFFYDRNGNLYKIEDESILKKRNYITIFNEKGEELELPADQADEYKLTPNERLQVINEIKLKMLELERVLSVFSSMNPVNMAPNPYIPQAQPLSQPNAAPVYPQPAFQANIAPQYQAPPYAQPTGAYPTYTTAPFYYGYGPSAFPQQGRMR